jgi:hypothetical protein
MHVDLADGILFIRDFGRGSNPQKRTATEAKCKDESA